MKEVRYVHSICIHIIYVLVSLQYMMKGIASGGITYGNLSVQTICV